MPQKRRKAVPSKKPRGRKGSIQEALVRALAHPVRLKALTILSDRTASPTEISEEIDEPLSNVSYHIRVLNDLGFIEKVEEERRRGSVASFYRAVEQPLLENEDWAGLDQKVREAVSGVVLDALISDAARSLRAGTFDERSERHLSRTPLVLDEVGWQRVLKVQEEALASIVKEQNAAAARLSTSQEKKINALAGMCCFEVPPDAIH
jgi:DNA-binding transcriptional ArsR family regulator